MNFLRVCFTTAAVLIGCASSSSAAVLQPLDPYSIDTQYHGGSSNERGMIEFMNNTGVTVSVYYINYFGDRQLYMPALLPNESYYQPTFMDHAWLVVEKEGATTEQGSGNLIAAFMPATTNPDWDVSLADRAAIQAVPEPSSYAMLALGLGMVAVYRRKTKKA
jgi:hypothetical protein